MVHTLASALAVDTLGHFRDAPLTFGRTSWGTDRWASPQAPPLRKYHLSADRQALTAFADKCTAQAAAACSVPMRAGVHRAEFSVRCGPANADAQVCVGIARPEFDPSDFDALDDFAQSGRCFWLWNASPTSEWAADVGRADLPWIGLEFGEQEQSLALELNMDSGTLSASSRGERLGVLADVQPGRAPRWSIARGGPWCWLAILYTRSDAGTASGTVRVRQLRE